MTTREWLEQTRADVGRAQVRHRYRRRRSLPRTEEQIEELFIDAGLAVDVAREARAAFGYRRNMEGRREALTKVDKGLHAVAREIGRERNRHAQLRRLHRRIGLSAERLSERFARASSVLDTERKLIYQMLARTP